MMPRPDNKGDLHGVRRAGRGIHVDVDIYIDWRWYDIRFECKDGRGILSGLAKSCRSHVIQWIESRRLL